MTAALRVFACLGLLATGYWCLPVDELVDEDFKALDGKFVGKATSELATALLQGYVEKEENLAYSPFGFSVLLAVFAEGAKGASRDEIASVLHFPKDVNLVRKAYKTMLERFAEKNLDSPEFKNWFYIFKNYSVNENVKEILRKCYLTEVKYVEKPVDTLSSEEKPQIDPIVKEDEESEEPEKSTFKETFLDGNEGLKFDDKTVEKVKSQSPEELEKVVFEDSKDKVQATNNDSEKKEKEPEVMPNPLNKTDSHVEEEKNISKETEKKSNEVTVETKDSTKEGLEEPKKDPKPFTETLSKEQTKIVDAKGVNVGSGETITLKTKAKLEVKDDMTVTSKSEIQNAREETTSKGEAVSPNESTNKADEDNLVESLKKKNMKTLKESKEKGSFKVREVQGAMPIEHLSGMTDSSIKTKDKNEEAQPQMILFNGMYYKGEWQVPFEKKPPGLSRAFYKSNKEKIYVPTIHSEGFYNASSIEDLGCQAIDIPYKGGRYSLLILVPNARDGLNKLISDLSGYPLSKIHDQLTEKLVEVCLPTFEINTISKPVSSVKKKDIINVKRIFDPELSDLSEISTADSGLFVDELVQMVTFKVDSEYTKANYLTASIGYSRSEVPNFQVNQPFLFFLRDKTDDLTLVNGKVVDPTPKPAFYFS